MNFGSRWDEKNGDGFSLLALSRSRTSPAGTENKNNISGKLDKFNNTNVTLG